MNDEGNGKLKYPIDLLRELIDREVGTATKNYFENKEIDKIQPLLVNNTFDQGQDLERIDTPKDKREPQLEERANARTRHQQSRKQTNIENVTRFASDSLIEDEKIEDKSVDEDWTARFFNYAEQINNEEMQRLWGRVLAGEVKRPGQYSIRTLEILKNISKHEAEVFTKVANLAIYSHKSPFIFKRETDDDYLAKYGIAFDDRLLLTELGLIQPDTGIQRQLIQTAQDRITFFEYKHYLLKATKKANSLLHGIPIVRFSKVGEDLLRLIVPVFNEEYIKDFSKSLTDANIDNEYAFIIKKDGDNYNHTIPWQKFTFLSQ